MHILEVIDGLTVGGAEKMVLILSRLLAKRQIPFSVVSFDSDWDTPYAIEIRKLGIPVHHFPGKLFNLCRIERLTQLILETRTDIVHTYLTYANIIGSLSAKLAKVPVITSLRSISLEPYHPLRSQIETWTMRYGCDMVMANGYSVAQAHQKRLGKKKIEVIQNSVGIESLPTFDERQAIRKELVGDPEKLIIITVGRLAPPKGYDTLIQAFSEVHLVHPETSLVIVGDGELRQSLEESVSSRSLCDSVIFTGERFDISRILPGADIFVSSSHWEGMSVAILEGMAAGLPVIATEVGDSPWIITENTGVLVEPRNDKSLANAILQFVENETLRLEFGKNARKRIETEYSLDRWCNQILNLYSMANPEIRNLYA